MNERVVVVCGPTCSGKSRFAMSMAIKNNGVIINADGYQVYGKIEVITASPSLYDKSTVPHMLYNYVSPFDSYSVGRYVIDANNAIANTLSLGMLPIIVGGSGMYIYHLLNGINDLPKLDESERIKIKLRFDAMGTEKFYEYMVQLIPGIQGRIKKTDSQRLMRAYEVFIASDGVAMWDLWNQDSYGILSKYDVETIKLMPDRSDLYAKINQRVISLINDGGLNEARELFSSASLLNASVAKTLLLRELFGYIDNSLSMEECIEIAQRKTRNYAKRQYTWFRNKF